MYVTEFSIPFAEDDAGNLCTVPGTGVKLIVKKKQPNGQPGRPKMLCFSGVPFAPALPVTHESITILPDGDYIADAVDASGQRVGQRIHFSVEHLSDPNADADRSSETSGASSALLEVVKLLKSQTEALHETLIKTLDRVGAALDKVTDALVEQSKGTAPVVEAAANLAETTRGGGLGKIIDDVREVLDLIPQGSNHLETILKSPVVGGAVMWVQKLVADMAKGAADRVVGFHEDDAEENEAVRAARAVHKMRAEEERRAARGE